MYDFGFECPSCKKGTMHIYYGNNHPRKKSEIRYMECNWCNLRMRRIE